ncbi:DUF3073 family protein [Naasia sp. SYSU D00057]|uniref:DUF3073 family protein n=1 Tax=Naasia sp. SYSU D00057 TaxID=2817380 RepID=UPI0035A87CA2
MARELKYYSPQTNYDALERELTGHSHGEDSSEYDKWAEYATEDDPSAEERSQTA